jgi:hypothetical protein
MLRDAQHDFHGSTVHRVKREQSRTLCITTVDFEQELLNFELFLINTSSAQ